MLMASVESTKDAAVARAMGWRTFRVAVTGEVPAAGEFHCPATAEQGHRETCQTCGACDGAGDNPGRANVIIWPHGPPAAVKSFYRTVRGDSNVIVHREQANATDRVLLDALGMSGTTSAAVLADATGRNLQSVATRLWHLRQMGLVRRVARGQYELAKEQA